MIAEWNMKFWHFNNCWHFNIYEQEKFHVSGVEHEVF